MVRFLAFLFPVGAVWKTLHRDGERKTRKELQRAQSSHQLSNTTMDVDRPSSPLSPPEEFHDSVSAPVTNNGGGINEDDAAGRARSKFSLAALCSPANSPSVRSSMPPTPALEPKQDTSTTSPNGLSATNGHALAVETPPVQAVPSSPSKKRRISLATTAPLAGESSAQALVSSEENIEGGVQDGEEGEEEDDEDEEDEEEDDDDEEEEEEGDEDDDEDDGEDEDEDEDEDDDEDDNSTASRDLDADEDDAKGRRKTNDALDTNGDVSMNGSVKRASLQGGNTTAAAVEDGEPSAMTSADGEATEAATTPTQPKKQIKRKDREPSVDVSLPKAPPALPTIRLPLKFTKTNYLFEIPKLLHKELKSQSHPWAAWWEEKEAAAPAAASGAAGGPPSASTSAVPEGLGDLGAYAHLLNRYPVDAPPVGEKKRRKRRKRNELEDYDVNDPFVDDSELQIDEPTHSAKPLSKGFYIAMGDVELETVAKKKRKGAATTAAGKSAASVAGPSNGSTGAGTPATSGARVDASGSARPHYLAAGTQLEVSNMLHHLRVEEKGLPVVPSMSPNDLPPTALGLVGTEPTQPDAGSRNSPIEVKDEAGPSSANKKKLYPMKPVDKRLAAEFEYLGRLVAAESFQVKSKFPPNLRQPLRKAAKIAIDLGQYNENFFNYLPNIFPYNRFTMSKLIKRDFYEDHMSALKELQDDVLNDMQAAIQEALPAHRAEYDEQVKLWKEASNEEPSKGSSSNAIGSETAPIELNDAGGSSTPLVADPANSATPEPIKKWKWTERMREDIFRIIVIENGMTELKAEKLKLEASSEQVSELNQRKAAYKRIFELWPEEDDAAGGAWTTTTAISTQFSLQKKKNERQNMAIAEQQQQQG